MSASGPPASANGTPTANKVLPIPFEDRHQQRLPSRQQKLLQEQGAGRRSGKHTEELAVGRTTPSSMAKTANEEQSVHLPTTTSTTTTAVHGRDGNTIHGNMKGNVKGKMNQNARKLAPKKSILKDTISPDIKAQKGKSLAWQDFHGKELYSVMEFVASEPEESDDEEVWEEKRACCSIQ